MTQLKEARPVGFHIFSVAHELGAVTGEGERQRYSGRSFPDAESSSINFVVIASPLLWWPHARTMAHPVTAVSWVAQCLHRVAATGRSDAWHSGQVLVGSGSPNTVVPRRRM
jgi:hypothetical protein